jgi:hypothetical protein
MSNHPQEFNHPVWRGLQCGMPHTSDGTACQLATADQAGLSKANQVFVASGPDFEGAGTRAARVSKWAQLCSTPSVQTAESVGRNSSIFRPV